MKVRYSGSLLGIVLDIQLLKNLGPDSNLVKMVENDGWCDLLGFKHFL